jgi:hypothetical protein
MFVSLIAIVVVRVISAISSNIAIIGISIVASGGVGIITSGGVGIITSGSVGIITSGSVGTCVVDLQEEERKNRVNMCQDARIV